MNASSAARIGSALVIFGEALPAQLLSSKRDTIIARRSVCLEARRLGYNTIDLGTLTVSGSVYEAGAVMDDLARLSLPDGTRLAKKLIYEGYELWWVHYSDLFRFYCIPYVEYKLLLEKLVQFESVCVYAPPSEGIFAYYLEAHNVPYRIVGSTNADFGSIGAFVQLLLTLASLISLVMRPRPLLVFTGDKFEQGKDYDFRLGFIYEELRSRKLSFVECIRGIEPWRKVISHAWVRRRPVLYSEAIALVSRYLAFVTGSRRRMKQQFTIEHLTHSQDPDVRFRYLIASHHLRKASEDIWSIRLTQLLLRLIGIRGAYITTSSERNYAAVLGCKLNGIPTVGILHGVASRYRSPHDFLPEFDGIKKLSVDVYGVWSEWWRSYYLKHSRSFAPEQLVVSGPMRPVTERAVPPSASTKERKTRVLFISEQVANPHEVMPFLRAVVAESGMECVIKFRPYRDGFEEWLKQNEPELLGRVRGVTSSPAEAAAANDVVVGSYSTAVLEALLVLRPPVFFYTRKWGDYYELKGHDAKSSLFAETPDELVMKIREAIHISAPSLTELRERFFGDSSQNGSRWVVDQLQRFLLTPRTGVRTH